jgi:hypothetical protein
MSAKLQNWIIGADQDVYHRVQRDVPISRITRSGGTATAKAEAHGLSVGDVITLSGQIQSAWRGTFTILTAADADTFTFAIGSAAPATLVGEVVCGVYLNNATVTAALKDSAGSPITGASSISFDYKANSDGLYVGLLPKAAAALLTEGSQYTMTITAVAATGETLPSTLEGQAIRHG